MQPVDPPISNAAAPVTTNSSSAMRGNTTFDLSGVDSEGFRLRGQQVTRLETFVDAAFAFAVTLLVVSFDAMPSSFVELYDALRRLPAFLAGFAILGLFWSAHHRFSRRFGLEDGMVVLLSMAMVAATLFYVYPLRMVMSAGMNILTGGWAPSEYAVNNFMEFRLIFVIYGVGFAVLAGLALWLNWHALRRAETLNLDAAERAITRTEIRNQMILMGTALLSIAIALALPERHGWLRSLPGMAYALLGILMPWHAVRAQRRTAVLLAQRGETALE